MEEKRKPEVKNRDKICWAFVGQFARQGKINSNIIGMWTKE